MALSTPSQEDSTDLDAPLSEMEFLCSIKSLKVGKSPGPDEFTPQFYKTLAPFLLPFLAEAFK